MRLRWRPREILGLAVAAAAPAVLTAVLAALGGPRRLDAVFLYVGLVAVLGALWGAWAVAVAVGCSVVLVQLALDPPPGDLLALAVTAGLVGLLAAWRRRALRRSEALAGELRRLHAEQARTHAALTLQAVDGARRELLENVSIELRQPLEAILAESASGLTSVDGSSEADRRLMAISGGARRLELLVDDMLDLAVIGTGALDLRPEPARLADAIEEAAERLHRTSPERAVEWDETAAGVHVLVDRGRLLQVFDNLLANADRFAPPGRPIDVEVEPDGAGAVSVRVRHQGPDLAADLPSRLGLAVVRGLVEAHDGSVAVETPDGPGSALRFTLPLAGERP